MTPKVKSKSKPKVKAKVKPAIFTGVIDHRKDKKIAFDGYYLPTRYLYTEEEVKKYKSLAEYNDLTNDEQNAYLKTFELEFRKRISLWYLVNTLSLEDWGTPYEETKLGNKTYLRKAEEKNYTVVSVYDEKAGRRARIPTKRNKSKFDYHYFRPTPHNLDFEDKIKQAMELSEKKYRQTHYCDTLTDAQFYTVLMTTPVGGLPVYMGKPLSDDNEVLFEKWKKTSPKYKEYLKALERVKKLRDGIEKPFNAIKQQQDKLLKPVKDALAKQQEALDALKQSAYSPTLEAIEKWRKTPNPFSVDSRFDGVEGSNVKGLLSSDLDVKIGEFGVQAGHGINSYIKRHKLKNKFEFAKHYIDQWKKDKTKIDYWVNSYKDVEALAYSVGLLPLEVFQQICHHIIKVREKLEKDEFAKDLFKIEALVSYFEQQQAISKANKDKSAYTLMSLYRSEYFKKWCKTYNVEKWFLDVKPKTGYNRLNDLWENWVSIVHSETNVDIMGQLNSAIDWEAEKLEEDLKYQNKIKNK